MLNSAAPLSGAVEDHRAEPPESGTAVRLSHSVLWLRLPLPMALDHVNVFAFRDDDGWTLTDTGMNTETTRRTWPRLVSEALGGLPVRRVILTHHHPDHVGMAGWFRSEFGAEILATRTAWLTARMLTLDAQDRPVAEAVEFYRGAGLPPKLLDIYKSRRPFNFADCVLPIPLGFTRIRDGDQLQFGGMRWIVRVGHGHAPSHATLWCEDTPLVIGGDQFLADITPNIGVYPTEPDADPLAEFLESCGRFAEFAETGHLVLPGHKRPYRGLPLRLAQLTEHHRAALARIMDSLSEPATAHELLNPLFGRPVPERERGMALVETVAHLNRLRHSGQARRTMGRDGVWMWRLV